MFEREKAPCCGKTWKGNLGEMQKMAKKSTKMVYVIISVLLLLALLGTVLWQTGVLFGGTAGQNTGAAVPANEIRAVYIGPQEWAAIDISTVEAMQLSAAAMFDNIKNTGLNTVIVSVNAHGDALYKSEVHPWSHLLTGIQGKDPGYDPLEVLVQQAHDRGLKIEAWVHPFRLQDADGTPARLANENLFYQCPGYVRKLYASSWLDPAVPGVHEIVTKGIVEIVKNYDVDGIHLYGDFYPANIDDSFDAESYAEYSGGEERSAWRRSQISAFLQGIYTAIKAQRSSATLGVSVSGDIENAYNEQFSDAQMWLKTGGYADYIMPQLYWGFETTPAEGGGALGFEKLAAQWAGYDRAKNVKLCGVLAANLAGQNDGAEWQSGHILADMIAALRGEKGFSGFAFYSYDALYTVGGPGYADTLAVSALLGGNIEETGVKYPAQAIEVEPDDVLPPPEEPVSDVGSEEDALGKGEPGDTSLSKSEPGGATEPEL
jgi:uncharacterized lipoprotein YddW (UPF0748 family)